MRRRSSTLHRRSFFKSFQIHLQAPDLLEEFLLARLHGLQLSVRLPGKQLGQTPGHFLLPLADLDRVDVVPGGYHTHRLDTFKGFQPIPPFIWLALLR